MTGTPITGACLCGAVRVRAARLVTGIQACHCTQCQRWTGGGPLFSVRVEGLQVQGEAATRTHRASRWGERVSCGTCGSILWWRMQGKPIGYVNAGLLDDQSGLSVDEEIFVDHRPSWLRPFEGAVQSTEAEELAKLKEQLGDEA